MFFFFYENLYDKKEIQQAFKITFLDRLMYEGYFDISSYIGRGDIKKEMESKLSAIKSKYADLYKYNFPKIEDAANVWNSVVKEQDNENGSELLYEEADAIVKWVYNCFKKKEEKEQFTREIFEKIPEFKRFDNIHIKEGIVYDEKNVNINFVSSISSLSRILYGINKNKTIFYRGHSNVNYSLRPSIMRTNSLLKNERQIYNELLINCPSEFENCSSHLDKLAKMQHYGLPTRLLDITRNFLVALFFACEVQSSSYGELILLEVKNEEIKYPESDTVSILASLPAFCLDKQKEFYENAKDQKLDIKQFNDKIARLIHEVRLEKPAFKAEVIKENILDSYIVYALKKNNRIIKQDGAFILCGLENQNGFLEKYRHKKDGKKLIILIKNKKKILKQLDTFSINHATLFPEVECVSEYIRNKYI